MASYAASALFFAVGPMLWAAGLVLFVRSPLPVARKIAWFLLLAAVGVAGGFVLPLASIGQKFVLVLLILPVLALADVLLMRSRRGFLFWLRACGFEVCTVFGIAALARLAFEAAHLVR